MTYGFAVENAKDTIKEVANYTIASNDDQGVLEAIDWMLKEEEMFSK
ncbi:MAG: HAD family hydrolase [Coprobacillaceae bacterium]